MKKIFLAILGIIFSVIIISDLISSGNVGLIESPNWEMNLTKVRFSSIAFGDLDNNGYKDLILTGCTSGGALSCGGLLLKFI